MEKDFKKIKRDLVFYRHIYLTYSLVLLAYVGMIIMFIMNNWPTWYICLLIGIFVFLIWIVIFRIKKERTQVRVQGEIFIKTLTSIQKIIQKREKGLLVLRTEFDELKKKENGIKLIQDRIAKIHLSSIESGISQAMLLGGEPQKPLMFSFSVPDKVDELEKLTQDMLNACSSEKAQLIKKLNIIQSLLDKFGKHLKDKPSPKKRQKTIRAPYIRVLLLNLKKTILLIF